MAYLITILFILLYGFGLFYWNKKNSLRIDLSTSRIVKTIHYAGLFICLIVSVLYINYDTGLRGLWTTRIIIILTFLTGIFFRFIANKASTNKIENWYFKIFSFLPIGIASVLLIPFLGIVIVLSLFGRLIDPANRVYYEDDKLRIQSSFVGVLGPSRIDIFKKEHIFEKHLKRTDKWESEIDSINVLYNSDSTKILGYERYREDNEITRVTEIASFKRIE